MSLKYTRYLYSLASRGSKPGLERILCALHELGDPQNDLRVINVTGTNGKGSFCALLGDILSRSGYRTGVFSSPHLEDIRESVCLDGEMICENVLERIIESAHPTLEKYELTQFEALTVCAVLFFKEALADIVIMEVGMGGRLDATNIFSTNLMSVILGVSLDHTSFLGSSVRDIAFEKSGIMKPSRPVFTAVEDPDALEVIKHVAKDLSCELFEHRGKPEIISQSIDLTVFEYKGNTYRIKGGALYQVKNALKVIDSLPVLELSGISISPSAIHSALHDFYRPARFEVFSKDPLVIFDGGHNPECTEALTNDLRSLFGDNKFELIVGVMADKDVFSICHDLATVSTRIYTVAPDNPRAMDPQSLAAIFLKNGIPALPCTSFEDALFRWKQNGSHPLICAGSLYSYREFKNAFQALHHSIKNN